MAGTQDSLLPDRLECASTWLPQAVRASFRRPRSVPAGGTSFVASMGAAVPTTGDDAGSAWGDKEQSLAIAGGS